MILLKRYLFDYIMVVLAALAVWIGVGWFVDGTIVTLTGFAFFAVLIGYIPYMIKSDYNRVKDYLGSCKEYKQGNISHKEFIHINVKVISEETGVPDFVVTYLSNKTSLTKNEK
jgi:hypothetical protein